MPDHGEQFHYVIPRFDGTAETYLVTFDRVCELQCCSYYVIEDLLERGNQRPVWERGNELALYDTDLTPLPGLSLYDTIMEATNA